MHFFVHCLYISPFGHKNTQIAWNENKLLTYHTYICGHTQDPDRAISPPICPNSLWPGLCEVGPGLAGPYDLRWVIKELATSPCDVGTSPRPRDVPCLESATEPREQGRRLLPTRGALWEALPTSFPTRKYDRVSLSKRIYATGHNSCLSRSLTLFHESLPAYVYKRIISR